MDKAQGSLSHPPHDGYRGEMYLSLHVLMSVCMVLLQDAMIVCVLACEVLIRLSLFFFLINLFIFGCVGSSLLRTGFL